MGGFAAPEFPSLFARYCKTATRHLRGFDLAFTLNELNLPLFVRDHVLRRLASSDAGREKRAASERALGSDIGAFFLLASDEAIRGNGITAHRLGRDAIKSVRPEIQVGVTLAVQDEQAEPGAEALRDRRRADFYGCCLEKLKGDDFIGVQTYTRVVSKRDRTSGPEAGHPVTVMGYEDRPQAIGATCRWVWEQTGTPILVTENGWAGDDDARRQAFIPDALDGVQRAIADGVDIRGYYYWSLLDNYEWVVGYGPRFGIVGVDRRIQRRQVKPSALVLGEIARRNALHADSGARPGDVPMALFATGAPVGA